MSYLDRIDARGQKRLLALDGGGIRGVITLEVLAEIERLLREETQSPELLLGDWFDYIGGTSTGAIIGAGLAHGMTVAELQALYAELGEVMFKPRFMPKRFWAKFGAEPLTKELRRVFGDMTFGDPALRCLLMLVLRNASTDSPWPLSNNPRSTYARNGDLPLWQLVRASSAAPTFFPAESVRVDGRRFMFVDGGLTVANDPAFQLFLMATLRAYRLEWATGPERMLLVSVGTGFSPKANANLRRSRLHLLSNAASIPSALMFAAMNQQDTLCRVFGDCKVGNPIDREIGDLAGEPHPVSPKLFTYLRYNSELSETAFRPGSHADGPLTLGDVDPTLAGIDPAKVRRLDAVDHVADLRRIGAALARRDVRREHYADFVA
jgi:uncharacterized protein